VDKLERLLNLTALLLETSRPLPIVEIQQLMDGYPADPDSFRRTFERDKRDLRAEGIPIDVVQIDPADETSLGYRIDHASYAQTDPGLAPEELVALRLAVAQLRMDGQVGLDTFRKLGGVPDLGTDAAAITRLDVPEYLRVFVDATRERRSVNFEYQRQKRRMEPHRVDHRGAQWYVSGRDLDRDARRTFRLDRVESKPECGPPNAFVDPGDVPGLRFEPWRFGDEPEQIATVRIDADHVHVARGRLGGAGEWTDQADGSALVVLRVTDSDTFRDLMIEFLDHAEVLEPLTLRDSVLEWIRTSVT